MTERRGPLSRERGSQEREHCDCFVLGRQSEKIYPPSVQMSPDIPCNYSGIMGVPITFLDKYSPDQFKIIGLGITDLGKSIGVGDYDRRY